MAPLRYGALRVAVSPLHGAPSAARQSRLRDGAGRRHWYTLRALLLVLALVSAVMACWAKEAAPESDDPVLEARVMAIAEELRCLVCQNETIAASRADLAVDLRKQIRLKLKGGESKQQIVDFMVARYGDFVLYRPPLKTTTLLLWLGPFVLLALAVFVLAVNIRRRHRTTSGAEAWSPAQSQRARALLDEGSGKP